MLWACELKPRGFECRQNLCQTVAHILADWLQSRNCPHYFINNCNLLDTTLDLELQLIATRLMSITESWLSGYQRGLWQTIITYEDVASSALTEFRGCLMTSVTIMKLGTPFQRLLTAETVRRSTSYERFSDRTRKLAFSTTALAFDTTSPANPDEYWHRPKTYIARNHRPWATFLPLTVWGPIRVSTEAGREPPPNNALCSYRPR